jgi:putative GTP pyrophosphokinase
MTDPEKPEELRDAIEKVLAQFDAREGILAEFCARTKNLIEASLQDAHIRYQSVQTRVKSRKKLQEKYLDPSKNYKHLDDITDLAGIRIITYYEDEVDLVAQVIKREFEIDPEKSIDKREGEPDRFGYSGVNYVGRHLPKRTADVEYKKFGGVVVEIQITSILRHAWAEIEHEWYDLRGTYPKAVKRRFYRIAALLDLAESEFLDIRNKRTNYERAVSVQVEAEVPDVPVDIVSVNSFIRQEPLVAELDKSVTDLLGVKLYEGDLTIEVAELRAKAARLAGLTRIEDLRDALRKHSAGIIEYVELSREHWIIGREASLGRGGCILLLAIMLAAAKGEPGATEVMTSLSLSIAFNFKVPEQIKAARQIIEKHSEHS